MLESKDNAEVDRPVVHRPEHGARVAALVGLVPSLLQQDDPGVEPD